MSLTAKDVAQITRLLEESSFDELYLELDGLKLSLRRGSAASAQATVDPAAAGPPTAELPATPAEGRAASAPAHAAPTPAHAAPTPGHAASAPGHATHASPAAATVPRDTTVPRDATVPRHVTNPTALTDANTLTDPNTAAVPAPLLGTFYRAPKPGAPPFVEIGAQVAEDTIVGIIEVMKLMNTVRAGVRGKVIQILARDGALVEYGETLLRVSKTS